LLLAALALAPAVASAAEAPVVSSLTPNELGSNGGQKVIIHGEKFTVGSVVHYGETIRLKQRTTAGAAGRDESSEKSATEIEMDPPFKEHGKRLVQVCNTELPEACSSATLEPEHNQMGLWTEDYKNEAAVGAARVPTTGYGEIQLSSPQINTQIECENIGFGSAWNEPPTEKTGPISGHGEILVWWASGHTPKGTHTELNTRCRFTYHGVEENQPTAPIAWASAEPPLHTVTTEGEVCTLPTEKLFTECPKRAGEPGEERLDTTVILQVSREGLSLPWNIQFTEKSEKPRVRIGLPLVCKHKEGAEETELQKCPEASERTPSKSPAACAVLTTTPDPPGCVKVEILTDPPLNLHMEYEGYVEPLGINGGPNGLSSSSWEFEGAAGGEPVLHLRETPTTEGSTTGNVKIIGFGGQELITAR
jgi:hypothetical protein